MYASTSHVYGHFTVTDQREASRHAADRYALLTAVADTRSQRVQQKRLARSRRGHATAPATA